MFVAGRGEFTRKFLALRCNWRELPNILCASISDSTDYSVEPWHWLYQGGIPFIHTSYG